MHTVIFDQPGKLSIPSEVTDLDSFLEWCESDQFPEQGRIWFIRDGVWADMSMEQIFSHNQVKMEITRVLGGLVKQTKTGRFFTDGLRITNRPAEISGEPDGSYASFDTLRAGRAKYVEGKEGGYTQLEGVPDLVIEIVSPSSEDKDTEWLQKYYWEAGISEYWLIDARTPPLKFGIFRHTARGYTSTRKFGGWVKSAVFGKMFRLTEEVNGMGHPDYTLELK
ncbi:MAG TPA: Uma2 family endonuclease [Gemmataceae bacterium]|nr:Uma2 family endonuclease [Gemmataceae bacterium]